MRTLALLAAAIVIALTPVDQGHAWIVKSFGPTIVALPGGDVVARRKSAWDVVRLDAATGREVWHVAVPGADELTVAPGGDPILAGSLFDGSQLDPVAVRIDQATGAELWRTVIPGPASLYFDRVAVDGAGNVFGGGNGNVAKFDGATGALHWQQFNDIEVRALAVDGAGDVLVAGFVVLDPPGLTGGTDAVVAKLAAATGTELWRYVAHGDLPTGLNVVHDVDVDGTGDVFVTGNVDDAALNNATLLAKLTANDGSELWRAGETEPHPGFTVVDAVGDVYSVRISPSEIVKRAGATGSEIWRTGGPGSWVSLSAQGAGRLLAAGLGTVSLVSQDAGTILWSQTAAAAFAFTVPAGGNAVAVGADDAQNVGLTLRFAPEVKGHQLRLIDRFGNPSARTLRIQSKDPLIHASAGPSSVGAPTLGGATLELRNPITAETVNIALPAVRWTARESSRPGTQVYTYRDPRREVGPCKKVVIESGRKIDIRCKGSGIAFTLDEPAQTALAVKLTTDSFSHCMLFEGASVVSDQPATPTSKGFFKAGASAAPFACS